MNRIVFAIAFFVLPVLSWASIDLEVKITRFPFTGEHYMFKSAESEKLFKSLFDEGRLIFKSFVVNRSTKPQEFDYGSKTPIGTEFYKLIFKDMADLKTFAEKLPSVPEYPFYGGREWGLFVAVRDYALKTRNKELLAIFDSKENSEERKDSASEKIDELYAPILKRSKK